MKWANDEGIFGGYPAEKGDLSVEQVKFVSFAAQLFSGVTGFNTDLLELLAMNLIRLYDSVVEDIKKEPNGKYEDPSNHPFVSKFQHALAASGVSQDVFEQWKKDAIHAYSTKNGPALPLDEQSSEARRESLLMDGRSIMANMQSLCTQREADHGALTSFCLSCLLMCLEIL